MVDECVLPATGGSSQALLIVAALLLLSGVGTAALARRRSGTLLLVVAIAAVTLTPALALDANAAATCPTTSTSTTTSTPGVGATTVAPTTTTTTTTTTTATAPTSTSPSTSPSTSTPVPPSTTTTAPRPNPEAVADTNSMRESTSTIRVSGNLLDNDIDPDGDALVVTDPGRRWTPQGVMLIRADGSYTYALNHADPLVSGLNDGETLIVTFPYSISDGRGGTGSSMITITIHGTTDGDPAEAVPDTQSVKEDTAPNPVSGNVLLNDTRPNGEALRITNTGSYLLGHGTLTIDEFGSYTYTLENANPAVNALNDGETLTDTFTYVMSDGRGNTDSAMLAVTINGTTDNQPPEAVGDTATVREDTAPNPVTGNVLLNDSDPDGDALSVSNAGTITRPRGTLVLRSDGSYTFTLNNSNPEVDALNAGQTLTESFDYNVADGRGGTGSAMLAVTINGTTDNRPPDAVDDGISVREDTAPNPVTGNVLGNDSDPDGDSLVVSPAGTYPSPYGSLRLNADGTYQFELDNSNGEVDALNDGDSLPTMFVYSTADGRGGTDSAVLTITINGTTD